VGLVKSEAMNLGLNEPPSILDTSFFTAGHEASVRVPFFWGGGGGKGVCDPLSILPWPLTVVLLYTFFYFPRFVFFLFFLLSAEQCRVLGDFATRPPYFRFSRGKGSRRLVPKSRPDQKSAPFPFQFFCCVPRERRRSLPMAEVRGNDWQLGNFGIVFLFSPL